MKQILTLNNISPAIGGVFDGQFSVSADCAAPDGILVRSFGMHDYALPESVLAVARAGAGTNNIPAQAYAEKGVVVFNTPGANANAVKELVIAALLLGARKIIPAIEWVKTLKDSEDLNKRVEKGKSAFSGGELYGKKLGVIGLGAIGVQVANAAVGLGMEVFGYDPYLSVSNALLLSRHVSEIKTLDELYGQCDFITVHIPLTDQNKDMFDGQAFAKMKDGAVLVNLARGELVDVPALLKALASGKIGRYITDFPHNDLIGAENAICIPHLGASTVEAEDNCAVMAAKQLKDYLENGNIANSVNYPNCSLPRSGRSRITLHHLNQNSMIAKITSVLAENGANIENFVNKSRGNYAYSIIDVNTDIPEFAIDKLRKIDGVIRVSVI